MTLGQKMGPARGHMVYIGLYKENMQKIFLSETTKARALLFGSKHHLVSLYKVCSNNAIGAKIVPLGGSHVLQRLIYAYL